MLKDEQMERLQKIANVVMIGIKGFKLCWKEDSALNRLLGILMWPFNRRYMATYSTIFITTLYLPTPNSVAGWSNDEVAALLWHERQHIQDREAFGTLFYLLSYLFLLPVVWTYRAKWEMRAYRETLRFWYKKDGEVPRWFEDWVVRIFTGPEYLWMCPFEEEVRRMVQEIVTEVKRSEKLRHP